MKNEQFLELFGADNVSPNIQRVRGKAGPPVYMEGGYASSLEELNDMKADARIGQIGGRRKKSRRKNKNKRKSYRRRRLL